MEGKSVPTTIWSSVWRKFQAITSMSARKTKSEGLLKIPSVKDAASL
jgi:hypothetical protein